MTGEGVAAALRAAWVEQRHGHGLTDAAADAVLWPAIYLAKNHPREFAAARDHRRAVLSGLAVNRWLREVGGRDRAPSSHTRYWRRACERMAARLNEAG